MHQGQHDFGSSDLFGYTSALSQLTSFRANKQCPYVYMQLGEPVLQSSSFSTALLVESDHASMDMTEK